MGKAKIQDGNFKLIHVVDLQNYQNLTNELSLVLDNEITKHHPFFLYLKHELDQVDNLLRNLKPHRAKRSLNFIGTAWKWIAGNPDHEDFEIIKDKINNVLKNNNKQVIINQLHNDRINNLTDITNKILQTIKKDDNFNDRIALSIQYKLKLIKEELINIRYAIHWAKSGIISSMILTKSEVKLATDILENEKLPYSTPEEALDFAEVKIITSQFCLFYIVYIPLTTDEMFEKLLLKPIKRHHVINSITSNEILRNNENMFGIVKDCKSFNYLTICKHINLINIRNSTCIPNLLKSLNSTCNIINNQHVPTVEEISQGVLLVNQFHGNINIDNIPQKLSGTFLIKFHNVTVSIEEKSYKSKERTSLQVLPAILQPTTYEKQYRELMSLEMMKELQINNTNQIDLLHTEKTIHHNLHHARDPDS